MFLLSEDRAAAGSMTEVVSVSTFVVSQDVTILKGMTFILAKAATRTLTATALGMELGSTTVRHVM